MLRRVNLLSYNMQYGPKLRARLPLFILADNGVAGKNQHWTTARGGRSRWSQSDLRCEGWDVNCNCQRSWHDPRRGRFANNHIGRWRQIETEGETTLFLLTEIRMGNRPVVREGVTVWPAATISCTKKRNSLKAAALLIGLPRGHGSIDEC